MALISISIVTAVEQCVDIMKPSDIPCSIVSSWQYPNTCSTYNILVYNSNQTQVSDLNMGDHATLPLCNATFNVTTLGSYLLNFSSGDTAIITVGGEDEMASLSVMLFVGAITFVLIYGGIKFNFAKNPVANLIFKRCLILFGLFLLSLDTTILVTIADNAGLGVSRELFRYLWIVNWTIYLFMIYLMWTTVTNSLHLWSELGKEERMGTGKYEYH